MWKKKLAKDTNFDGESWDSMITENVSHGKISQNKKRNLTKARHWEMNDPNWRKRSKEEERGIITWIGERERERDGFGVFANYSQTQRKCELRKIEPQM